MSYCATITTDNSKQEIGYYRSRILANKAIKFLMEYYPGADYRVEECSDNNNVITKIDMVEYQRLLDLKL